MSTSICINDILFAVLDNMKRVPRNEFADIESSTLDNDIQTQAFFKTTKLFLLYLTLIKRNLFFIENVPNFALNFFSEFRHGQLDRHFLLWVAFKLVGQN